MAKVELLPVVQLDREAAVQFYPEFGDDPRVLTGFFDSDRRIQAIARYRSALSKQPDEAAVGVLRAALDLIANQTDIDCDFDAFDAREVARAALAALQADTPDKEMGDG